MCIFLFEVHLEVEKEYKHLRINPECFNELFALAKNIVTKQIANMRDKRREN